MQQTPETPVIVSIQSQLVYGCAGNNAAVPLLQALGATVYAVPTVILSNTPIYPSVAGIDLPPATVHELLEGLLERVAARELHAILTGYMRDPATIEVVAGFIDRVRQENPDIIVLVDPVLGDTVPGLFIPAPAADAVRDLLVPRSDIITPNQFEVAYITGIAEPDPATLQQLMRPGGTGIALLTGLGLEPRREEVSTLAIRGAERWSVGTPRLDIHPTGTGDITAATFLFHWLQTGDVAHALSKAVEAIYSLLQIAAGKHVENRIDELEPARLNRR